uniref:Metalloendopeptidase n=1 Tax=Strongyloides venezuelensis TaxID=75913 RepID=A0A0K0FQJ6_STRVS
MFLPILLSLLGLSLIVICDNEDYLRRDKRIIKVQNNFNYTNPVIYHIHKDIKDQTIIKKALTHLEHYTCIKFKSYSEQTRENGITFLLGSELDVKKGPYGKKLAHVYLTQECYKHLGCVKHMLGRAFGLHYETARYDRYHYIKILWKNIEKKSKKIFSMVKGFKSRYFNTAFDYGSIMMPNITEGAKPGKKSYRTKGSKLYENMVGQRGEFSFNDLKKINDVFCGGRCSPKCGACECPTGYSGKYCEKLAASQGDCGKRFLFAKKREQTLTIKGTPKCVIGFYSRPRTNLALVVKKVKTTKLTPCIDNKGIEIKYRHDKGATGLVFCGTYSNVVIKPTFSRAVMIYYSHNKDDMISLTYREVRRTRRR